MGQVSARDHPAFNLMIGCQRTNTLLQHRDALLVLVHTWDRVLDMSVLPDEELRARWPEYYGLVEESMVILARIQPPTAEDDYLAELEAFRECPAELTKRSVLERDVEFLNNAFCRRVGVLMRETLTDLASVEQYKQRKAAWPTTGALMQLACQDGLERTPNAVPHATCTYFMSLV